MTTSDRAAQDSTGAPAGPGLLRRVVGVVVGPVETFGHVARDPRPAGMILFVSLVSAAATALFFSTEVGKVAWLDSVVTQQESLGRTINDVQYAGMERLADLLVYLVPIYSLVVGPLATMAIAGLLKAAFAVIAGGEATFKQTLGVVAASGVILLLRAFFVLPLNYVQESMASTTSLAVLLPMLSPEGLAGRFLGMIDLFAVWWVAVLSAGLAVLYRRSPGPITITLFALYGVIAGLIALVLTWVGGS
jgi:hypothetical protein